MEINASSVFLVVLVFFVIFFSWRFLTTGRLTKKEMLNLAESVPDITAVVSPFSSVYTYSMWVFVNTWSQGEKTIFRAGLADSPDCALVLGSTTPTLNIKLKGAGAAGAAGATQTMEVTDNFPITKWVFITVAVNVNVVDCYLNGKLVKTQQLASVPPTPSSQTISFGKFDCNLVGFQRTATYLDPATVWAQYSEGNGVTRAGPFANIPSYGLSVGITKDGVADKNFTLW